MTTATRSPLHTEILLLLMLAGFPALAQDKSDDDLLPAVDTSATARGVDPTGDAGSVTASDDDQPVTDSAALPGSEITRSTSGSRVMDSLELGRTEITGNQELPKVLYIVPWKKSDPGDLMGKPVNSLLDEVLAPIDREEFVRQIDYYGDLYGEDEQE